MASSTRGRESRRGVIGIRGSGVILRVAAVAVHRQRCVVVIDVARGAGNCDVGAGQRELRLVMVEGRTGPGSGAMTRRARGWEADGRMGRRIGVIEIGLVAAIAVSGKPARIVVIHVARHTRHIDMRAGQRESRSVVIEGRVSPYRNRMADRAVRWETACEVIGLCRPVEVSLMARIAGGRR